MRLSGIYQIQSKIKPERIYIGSSVDIKNRKASHFKNLNQNKHHSKKLQYHYNKYGKDDLIFSILCKCDKDKLIIVEQFYIDAYQPWFNVCPTAGSRLGIKQNNKSIHKRVLKLRKPVFQYGLDGIFIKEWDSARTASKSLLIGHIHNCCKKYRESAGGFMWRYKEVNKHYSKIKKYINNKNAKKPIIQFNFDGTINKEWGSIREAANTLGITKSTISSCLKGKFKQAGGFVWKYKK